GDRCPDNGWRAPDDATRCAHRLLRSSIRIKPLEMRTALASISDASLLLPRLLEGNHSKIAGRLAGAFRNIGRTQTADQILAAMRGAGFVVTEVDPCAETAPVQFSAREVSPYVNRMTLIWDEMRAPIIEIFA